MEEFNNHDPLNVLKEGLYSMPQGFAANEGWSTGQSSMLSGLGDTVQHISDQYQGQRPLEDSNEEQDDGEEQQEHDPQESSLQSEIARLTKANAFLQNRMTLSTSTWPSVTSHSSKFVRLSDVLDGDLLETQVTLFKANYGDPGSSDYRKNMPMANCCFERKVRNCQTQGDF
jgi:hypothetical protein